MTKQHWKELFGYKYLGAYSILGDGKEDLTVTIKRIYTATETVKNGQTEEFVMADFEEVDKPMIMNKTNCKTIASLYTHNPNNWIGKPITLYATRTKFGREEVDALRVRNFKPQVKNLDVSKEKEQLLKASSKSELKQLYKSFSAQAQKELKQFVIELSKELA
jgi:hypothetical protein